MEVFVYPNAFAYGTPVVDVTYIPGSPASLADGQWSADVTLSNVSVTYTDLITSAADCDLTLTPAYSCCTDPVVTNQTPIICSNLAGTVDLTSYESAINNDGTTSFLWYSDAALMNAVANPNSVAVTDGDIFYAEVSEGTCSSTATVTFTIETLNPSISSLGTVLDCNTTSILLDAGAGYASYQWSDGSTTAQTLSVTMMGTYTVTVSSANGCIATASTTITQNFATPTADIQASTLTLDCNNASSTLDASGSSGTGTISHAWSDSSTNPTLVVNAPGTYTVVITDSANGCTASNSVTVIENPPLVITNLQENCDASNTNYTVTFNISGGSGSYLVNSVAISGNTYTSTPIASGSAYNFMIEDDQGCPAAIQSGMLVCTPNFCSSSTGCFGPNLITNGDFETGNTGFTSDYDYSSCPGTICTNSTTGQPILCQYDYGIGTNPSDCNADWPSSIVDHTSGSGNMMIVDFPAGDVSPNNNIWCQMVTVSPNTDYCFSAHFINLLSTGSNQPEPIFEFTVDGVLIGTTTSIGETEQWENQGFQFNSNANTNVEICIRNNNFGNVGFDLAIDDITLSSINTGTPPSLVADAGIICGNDTDITIDVASNDMPLTNLDLNTLSIEVAPPFSEGSITAIDQVNGTITFTPSAGFSGATSFEYQLCDNSGCCSTAMVNITSGNNPSISGTAADITCLPSSGMIDITVSGGMPGYIYDWSDDAFDGMDDITVSTSGTYTITVSDMNGCSASNSFTVADNDDMPMANVSSLVSVLDCNNTMISLDASGSSVTGTISYTWSDMSTNPTLDVSTPGTYTVIITDTDNGCTASTSSTITQNIATPTASISPTGTMLDCTTTSVNLDASGSSGVGTLSYLWSDNSSNAILTVGTAGTYTVIVTDDANGCTASSSVTVNQDPSVPSAVINAPYWVLDCNNANVTLDASASSGTGTITYEWNDMSTNSTLNVSTPGSYTVVITDSANGCSASTSVTITEDTAAPMTNLVSNNMTLDCNNSSATLDASGSTGTGTIGYVWNDLSTNPTLTTSIAGTYTVIISDSANGCTASSSMTISQDITAPIADIAASTLTLDCNNSSTTLDASGSSGTGTISYEWSDMSINSTLTTSTAGIYTVIISDSANGCTASTSITIGQDIAITTPTIAASATEFDCNVSSIDLDAGAGYASYLWSDNSSSQMISITNPGDYTVIVSTANGCTASSSITVGSSATLTASITGDLSICPQGGSTTLDASNPNATSYLWSNNETGASISVNIPGIYSVTISDGICDAQTSVTVIASNAPSPTITGDNSICAGTPGSLDAGGGYSNYLWSSGETSQTIAVSSASTYTVTVTNGDGCTGTDSHIVTETSPPIYEVIDNTTICIGGNIAIGTIEAQGVTYSWTANPADPSLVDPNIGIPTVSPTVTTTYTLTASQGTCVAIESVIITVEDPMVNTSNVTTCPGEGAMLSASGSPSGGTYTWADWQGNQIGTGSDFEVNPFTSTSYFVTYTVNGCNVSEVVLVDVLDNPSISIDASATEIILGENATLTVLDAPVGSTFNWIESGLEQLPDEGSVVINPTESTTYTVEVTTPDGCIYYASISILVQTPSEIEIPNIFTPNGDDLNDEFYIADGNLNYDVIEFKVFDRWGEVVHDNPGNGWNGTHNGKALPSDIYIYLFRVRNLNGKIDTMKGDVALVR